MTEVQEIKSSSQEKDLREENHLKAVKIVFSFAESMAVKAVLLLELPDIIFRAGGSAMSVAEISQHLSPSPPAEGLDVLRRIMRFLGVTGFFTVQGTDDAGERRYGLSPVAKCFVQRPGVQPRRDMFLVVNDKVLQAGWHHFHECVIMGGDQPFVRAHGMDMWKYAATDSRFNDLFNKAMTATTALVASSLLSSYEGFGHVSSLVDIAGGTGALAEQIVKRHPNISSAINFDLPHVIATAPERSGVEHRAGDMFESVPGAECMLLKFILHDWNDVDCVRILKACKAALPPNGHVVIVDVVLPEDENMDKSVRGLTMDLLMIAITTGGRERRATEWRKLLLAAGFSNMNIVALPAVALGLTSIIKAFL